MNDHSVETWLTPRESRNGGATGHHGGSILLVGDGADIAAGALALETLAETRVVRCRDAFGVLAGLDVQVLIVDCRDPDGRAILKQAAEVMPHTVRIQLGGDAAAADGVAVVLPRSVDPDTLRPICELALHCAAVERAARDLEEKNERLRGVDAEASAFAIAEIEGLDFYSGILTRSPAMKRLLTMIDKISASDTTVLVHGETGTGKELMAQAIHAHSRRRDRRFVTVNLGAISDHLRESELFGHVRGAFTGATASRSGLFAEADGGTIFLDEVGDASPGLQVALLRALEEGTILPVGADRPRKVDVRVISGTNRNLESLVRQGLFRRDLYYRLHVFPIGLPPLRERPEDIFPLAQHFLARASHAMGKKPPGISREARAVLEAYHWEGNVRELRNVMERAAILCKGGLVIAADLPVGQGQGNGARGSQGATAATIAIPLGGAPFHDLEREIFEKTLALACGNKRRAARILGLRESTFRFRLRKLAVLLHCPPPVVLACASLLSDVTDACATAIQSLS